MTQLVHPVVLCGGSGTRLWPRSRKDRPKPFLPLLGERTLFQQTLDRCRDPGRFAAPLVVAGAAHQAYVLDQSAPGTRLIVEPASRNTAPAIALAAAALAEDAIMLVCPSDHHIADAAAFRAAVDASAALARDGWLVALGIAPDRPETGYGYIRRGDPIAGGYRVARFVEKPDLATAQGFLAQGGHDWNGGIFAFTAGVFLEQLARFRPAMAELARAAVAGVPTDAETICPLPEPFSAIAAESIDYAVMENTDRAAVVPAAMGWSDVGNWQALRDARPGDAAGNRVAGPAELIDCRNVLVDSDGPHVSVVGLDDVMIVVDGDSILVTSGSGAQQVGTLSGAKAQ